MPHLSRAPRTWLPEAREERLAKNDVLFRSVNEAIEERAAESDLPAHEFIYECSSSSCAERVELTRLEYEHVRAEGPRFFVVPGHETREVEVVVETQPTYLIVENEGLAGVVAACYPASFSRPVPCVFAQVFGPRTMRTRMTPWS